MRLAVVLALLGGCGGAYPHDRLVIVEISSALDAYEVHVDMRSEPGEATRQIGPMLADGIRAWDALGAKFRTHAQCADDGIDEHGAPVLRIVGNGYHPPGTNGADAWWSTYDGEIHVAIPPKWGGDEANWRALAAHEVGHAMGLSHIGGCALMSPDSCSSTVTQADVNAFRAAFGG